MTYTNLTFNFRHRSPFFYKVTLFIKLYHRYRLMFSYMLL